MKMKLMDRFLMRIFGILSILAGAVAIAGGILLYGKDLGTQAYMVYLPLALVAAGAVIVLIALFNMVMPKKYGAHRGEFVEQQTEHGTLRIAVSALENLILKCVEMHKELKVQEIHTVQHKGDVRVFMRVAMNANVSIPNTIELLQDQITKYISASSGITLKEISFTVDRTAGELSTMPADLPEKTEDPVVDPVREEPAEAKKVPVHQRIFGRDTRKTEEEQIVEAEHIELPAEHTEAPAEGEQDVPAQSEAAENVDVQQE